MTPIFKLILSPTGRIGRKAFWIGFAGFIGFLFLMNFFMDVVPKQSALEFWLGLSYFFLFFWIMYCVYGKRLHDMGRSIWPITGCIVVTFIIMIAVMMSFGGAEYFSEFAQYDRKDTIDPARRDAITKAYESQLANGEKVLGPLLTALWLGFTLWTGLVKSELKTNRYGKFSETSSIF